MFEYIQSTFVPCNCTDEDFHIITTEPFEKNVTYWHIAPFVVEIIELSLDGVIKHFYDIHCPVCKAKAINIMYYVFRSLRN